MELPACRHLRMERSEMMASEALFEEQSNAVKVSEPPYPTEGSGKDLA